jgi:hypothetical protein
MRSADGARGNPPTARPLVEKGLNTSDITRPATSWKKVAGRTPLDHDAQRLNRGEESLCGTAVGFVIAISLKVLRLLPSGAKRHPLFVLAAILLRGWSLP